MVDILASIERDERAMERIAAAMESIADSYTAMYKLMAEGLDKVFPPKHEPRDAIVTRLLSDEDRLKASQGATGEATIEQWTELGPRERELVEKTKNAPDTAPKK